MSAPEPTTPAPAPEGPPPALAALAALGPFFAVQLHARTAAPSGPWRPLAELTEPGPVLHERVRRVRAALAARVRRSPDRVEVRVAVSVTHLGLVARLLAPAIGAAALGRAVSLDSAGLWWQDEIGGPYPLSVADPAPARPVTARGPAGRLPPAGSAGSAVEEITTACLRGYSVSPRVLWGNVASAAVGAAGLVAAARPDLASPARAAADAVLADDRVEGGVLRAGPAFRRHSCCLIYRLAGSTAAVCGDCVLLPGSATAS